MIPCSCDASFRFCYEEFFKANQPVKQEELLINKKFESFGFSNNLQSLKEQLESHFNLFLEGHLDEVNTVTVTSDNKYIISGSDDKTIRI